VTHIAALPGNPYDGHTLATVIPAMEDMIGNTIERLLAVFSTPKATIRNRPLTCGFFKMARYVELVRLRPYASMEPATNGKH
jgi:hypothetical protein